MLWFYELWHRVVWYVAMNASEEHTASVFSVSCHNPEDHKMILRRYENLKHKKKLLYLIRSFKFKMARNNDNNNNLQLQVLGLLACSALHELVLPFVSLSTCLSFSFMITLTQLPRNSIGLYNKIIFWIILSVFPYGFSRLILFSYCLISVLMFHICSSISCYWSHEYHFRRFGLLKSFNLSKVKGKDIHLTSRGDP
jgi:hypothetical protein